MYNDQCFRDAMQNPAQNFQQIKKSKKENTFVKELFVDFQLKKKNLLRKNSITSLLCLAHLI